MIYPSRRDEDSDSLSFRLSHLLLKSSQPQRIYSRSSLPILTQVKSSLAKSSLREFCSLAWPIISPSTPLKWNWHLDKVVEVLEAINRGEVKRVIFNQPPGTMKSMLVSVLFPAWEWSDDPWLKYLTVAYSDDNTIRDNLLVRDIVSSQWYQDSYWRSRDVTLSDSQSAKIRFNTSSKGWRIASSVGGVGTGEHPDRIILDDLLKAKDIRSPVKIEAANDYISTTISTRVANDPAIILIGQRLHLQDSTGYLTQKGGWEIVKFPMRFIISRPATASDPGYQSDPRDQRVNDGELLWPEMWPEEKVQQAEILLGPYGSASQFQQNPLVEGGGLFKRDYFPVVQCAPANARRCRGWDTADTPEATALTVKTKRRPGDWTVGVRISESKGIYYIEHVIRTRAKPGVVDTLICDTAKIDGHSCAICEGDGSGKAIIAKRAVSLSGYDYTGYPETEDKVTRAGAFRAQCEAGNVRMVAGDWNEAYLDVMCAFPVGPHDDDVDASSNAFNKLTGRKPKSTRVVWGRRRQEYADRKER